MSSLVDVQVQVGCQTDNIGHAAVLKRASVVYSRFNIDSEMVEVYNLWGGLIYMVAPANSNEGELEIIVQNAIRAPYYKSGESQTLEFHSLGTGTYLSGNFLISFSSGLQFHSCNFIPHFNPWKISRNRVGEALL